MHDFKALVENVQYLNRQLQHSAVNTVNRLLTIRNWLIGYYIVEFEQNGNDRAEYGKALLKSIAAKLNEIKGMDERSLRRYRLFYQYYPHLSESIRGTLSPILTEPEKVGTLSPISHNTKNIRQIPPQIKAGLLVPCEKILAKLSYSHIELLLGMEDQLKRTFYEVECIKGTWSVRELKRQINSQYFERSSLSKNPEKLSKLISQETNPQAPVDIIKNIYAFEFLDLPVKEIVEESDLEKAILNNLQNFIIELGYGFCFEARQKRILIGEKYYFIDLVFYHRILKCHVLLELKIGEFDHGNIGQLNTYLNFFNEEIRETGDNPPVGILLVAEKDQALVKYATAGLDQNLFIQQYMLKLPDTEMLKQYIERELRKN